MNVVKTVALAFLCAAFGAAQSARSRIVSAEFIYERAPFPSAHASTIVETRDGFLAGWFGGSRESAPDVGIWIARRAGGRWSVPEQVAAGVAADGSPLPCWNPVLFANAGILHLFYKVGRNPREWWGMEMRSTDEGRTWTRPARLPEGILGPIKNKPMRLSDGEWLSGSSTEAAGDGRGPWRVHFERTTDAGRTWTRIEPPPNEIDAIQPALLLHPGGRVQAIGRTRQQRLFSTWSSDHGRTWTPLSLLDVPNPNAGVDAVTLQSGLHVLAYNPTIGARTPLSVAISTDGIGWQRVLDLETEPGEYSYPAVIQSRDGLVHVTYTWRRERIKHVVIDMSGVVRHTRDATGHREDGHPHYAAQSPKRLR